MLALGVASLIFGFPIFFDAGLVIMLPVIFAVARRMGGTNVLLYGIPAAAAFSVMHVFVPPHPGPVSDSEFYGANLGLVLLLLGLFRRLLGRCLLGCRLGLGVVLGLLVGGLALERGGDLDGLHRAAEGAGEDSGDHRLEPLLEALQGVHAGPPLLALGSLSGRGSGWAGFRRRPTGADERTGRLPSRHDAAPSLG